MRTVAQRSPDLAAGRGWGSRQCRQRAVLQRAWHRSVSWLPRTPPPPALVGLALLLRVPWVGSRSRATAGSEEEFWPWIPLGPKRPFPCSGLSFPHWSGQQGRRQCNDGQDPLHPPLPDGAPPWPAPGAHAGWSSGRWQLITFYFLEVKGVVLQGPQTDVLGELPTLPQ